MRSIAELAAEPFAAGNTETVHIMEDASGHLLLKKLIHGDKDRVSAGKGTFKAGVGCFHLNFGLQTHYLNVKLFVRTIHLLQNLIRIFFNILSIM